MTHRSFKNWWNPGGNPCSKQSIS